MGTELKMGDKLKIKDAWNQKIQRENDVFVMDKICDTPRPLIVLEKLNDVQLWLKVSQLSDIVKEAGNAIEPWAFNGLPKNLG